MATILYPPVRKVGTSFIGVKRQTVPKQSLSLREILRRFVRREPLPVSKEGVYEERFGDLEKMAQMDIFDKFEKVEWLKAQIAMYEKRESDNKLKADADAKAAYEAAVLAKAKEMAKSASPARGPAEGQEASLRS